MSLQSKAMLVALSVSCWTARKQDKSVSAEVEKSHNARDAGRYNKLLVDKQHLDPLTSFAGQIRTYHYKMTLPWMDNGARLLPSILFMEYSAQMRKLKTEYENLVHIFINLYDTKLIQDARVRLGTMFNPDDYPPSNELASKFNVETDIMPVPSGSDFRVDVTDTERARIADDISRRVAERQAAATRDAWARVRDAVTLVNIRLNAPKAIIRDSLIDNARDLARLLPGLNISADPLMDQVCQLITDELLVDPARLRRSATLRKSTATTAAKILELIPGASSTGTHGTDALQMVQLTV